MKFTPRLSYLLMEREYRKALKALTREILDSFRYWALAEYPDDSIIMDASPVSQMRITLNELHRRNQRRVNAKAKILITRQLARLKKYALSKYKKDLAIDFTPSQELDEILKARYAENIALIKTIPAHVMASYASVMYSQVVNGDRQAVLARLSTIDGVSMRRASIIARDQTAKALESINVGLATGLGLEYYQWVTLSDERVSTGFGGHRLLDGKIFRFDTPEAIIDSYGHKGHPKERPLCRCSARGIYMLPGERMVKTTLGYKLQQ